MSGYKVVLFTPRLVTFNETFAPLGKSSATKPNIPILWHEATSGRNASDIASAFWSFLNKMDSSEALVLWLEKCSAQNKNWTLFSTLVKAVHIFKFETITLKFFEPGHTFMAADSVHAAIEKQMKKQKEVFDFPHFVATSG
jgi:hypothetical protein